MSTPDDEAARRAARANWPIVKTTLQDAADANDLRATTTMEERVAMMWRLSRDAWVLSGRPFPSYERANIPIRIVRGEGA